MGCARVSNLPFGFFALPLQTVPPWTVAGATLNFDSWCGPVSFAGSAMEKGNDVRGMPA